MEVAKTYCSKCQRDVKIESFEGDFKTCNVCRKKGKHRYYRLREHYLELKKDYRQNHKEEIAEKQKDYFQSIKGIVMHYLPCL